IRLAGNAMAWFGLHRLPLPRTFKARTTGTGRAVSRKGCSHFGDATVFNDLALIYRQNGEIEKAIATLKKAVLLNPDLPEAYNNLGGLLRETGDVGGAEQAFRSAIRSQPELAAAHTNLGIVLVAR